ncbi:MAG: sugar ABC transporter substrate-binding protein, partial [Mucilaginibacter sp.]
HIKIIGYDLLPKNINFLNKGFISFLINQNPEGQGYWGVHYLAKHIVFNKDVPPLKYLPLDVVTKENLAYFTNEEELLHI